MTSASNIAAPSTYMPLHILLPSVPCRLVVGRNALAIVPPTCKREIVAVLSSDAARQLLKNLLFTSFQKADFSRRSKRLSLDNVRQPETCGRCRTRDWIPYTFSYNLPNVQPSQTAGVRHRIVEPDHPIARQSASGGRRRVGPALLGALSGNQTPSTFASVRSWRRNQP